MGDEREAYRERDYIPKNGSRAVELIVDKPVSLCGIITHIVTRVRLNNPCPESEHGS